MIIYLITFILLIIFLQAYFRIADHFNIIDKPNRRSSHHSVTIRGGGIVFPFTALLWYVFYGFQQTWIMLALMLITVVSFLDDIVELSSRIRIFTHFTAVIVLFHQLQLFGLPWYYIVIAFVLTIGWINAFNFMDGINGISAFYSFVTLVTFYRLNWVYSFVPSDLLFMLMLAVIVFSIYNARKQAKTFAGDIGSVSLAFLLGWFMISLIIKTGRIEYILFFSIYGIDAAITIIYRLKRGENIFKAHRSHLYQFLCNELGRPHVQVSAIYAGTQLVINVITIWLISEDYLSVPVFVGMFIVLTVVYLWMRYEVTQKIEGIVKE